MRDKPIFPRSWEKMAIFSFLLITASFFNQSLLYPGLLNWVTKKLSKFQSATSKDTQTRDINVTKSSKNHTISSPSTSAAQCRLEYGPLLFMSVYIFVH
eukprot:sb/3478767/